MWHSSWGVRCDVGRGKGPAGDTGPGVAEVVACGWCGSMEQGRRDPSVGSRGPAGVGPPRKEVIFYFFSKSNQLV
jgi:hypothetical protein